MATAMFGTDRKMTLAVGADRSGLNILRNSASWPNRRFFDSEQFGRKARFSFKSARFQATICEGEAI